MTPSSISLLLSQHEAAPGDGEQPSRVTGPSLSSALRAGEGLCTLEAATGLIIAQESWMGPDDFARFILWGPGTAVSLAREIPVGLGDAVTGIDRRNVALLLTAIRQASGHG